MANPIPAQSSAKPEEVYCGVPAKLMIDEDSKTRYSTSTKIDTLMEELQKGPLVAFGYLGPQCYTVEPGVKNTWQGCEIYGWAPGTARKESAQKAHALVAGARKGEGKELVYFRMSQDVTLDTKTYIREHCPTSDTRLFVSSHKTFSDHLVDLYPSVPKEKTHPNFVSSGSINCSNKELPYVLQLVALDLNSILDGKEGEAACKKLGQKIFDTFKKENGNNSYAAKDAVVNICNALKTCAKDGSLRKQYVEYAWEGIGDTTWTWRR